MRPEIYPIAYSGIKTDDLNEFIENGVELSLACQEPLYVGEGSSIWFSASSSGTWGRNYQFIIRDDYFYHYGFREFPWATRINFQEISSEYKYAHWGAPLTKLLGTNCRVLDPVVKKKNILNDGRRFLLVLSNNIPMLLVYNGLTNLFTADIQKYGLYGTSVDHTQWITTPDGEYKILILVDGVIYFITIPDNPTGYPTIGSRLDASIFKDSGVTSMSEWNTTPPAGNYIDFYYHGNTLCVFLHQFNSEKIRTTSFYHYDNGSKTFVKDLSLPYGGYTYYSQYNNAVNMLAIDQTFIGDYRWYMITPASDLYTYINTDVVASIFKLEQRPDLFGASDIELLEYFEVNNEVYFVYNAIHSMAARGRIVYQKVEQPLSSTLLANINLGSPYSVVSGTFTIEGSLFVNDFQWEILSKTPHIITHNTEISVVNSQVNLRLTPTVPQIVKQIIYEELTPVQYIVSPIDEFTHSVTVPFKELVEYSEAEIFINYDSDVSPWVRFVIGDDGIRHCINNAGNLCIRGREEYKTPLCKKHVSVTDSGCPLYIKNIMTLPLIKDGNDLVGTLYDERENFTPFTRAVDLVIRMRSYANTV